MEVTQQDSVIWKKKLLDILKFTIKVCEEHGLKYFVCGGTAIGTVRHHGFIPWDDDIDIIMPRPDFIEFERIMKEMNDADYEFFSYSSNKDYFHPMGKVSDKHTTLLELDSQNFVEGLYLDVFPLDGCSNSFEEFKKDLVRYQHLYLKLQVVLEPMNKRLASGLLRMIKKRNFYFLRYLPYYLIRTFLKREKIIAQMVKIEKSHRYEDSNFVACYSGSYNYKEYIPKEWLGTGRKMSFEGVDVIMPENYDAYLNHFYGDYMELPPESKRVSHHFAAYYNLNERLTLAEARMYIK